MMEKQNRRQVKSARYVLLLDFLCFAVKPRYPHKKEDRIKILDEGQCAKRYPHYPNASDIDAM